MKKYTSPQLGVIYLEQEMPVAASTQTVPVTIQSTGQNVQDLDFTDPDQFNTTWE